MMRRQTGVPRMVGEAALPYFTWLLACVGCLVSGIAGCGEPGAERGKEGLLLEHPEKSMVERPEDHLGLTWEDVETLRKLTEAFLEEHGDELKQQHFRNPPTSESLNGLLEYTEVRVPEGEIFRQWKIKEWNVRRQENEQWCVYYSHGPRYLEIYVERREGNFVVVDWDIIIE